MMRQLAGCLHLLGVSFRRLVRSRQTMVSLLLLAFATLAVIAWGLRRTRSPADFVDDIFLPLYLSLLLPVFSLCYGTAGIAPDREERTLVYLLVTPLPRPLIFAAKAGASLLVTLIWTMGGLLLLCWLGGAAGRATLRDAWLAVLLSSTAHVALFVLFSVLFRRATVLALAYALFLETLVGNLPGIAKRASLSFYTRSAFFDAAAELDLQLRGPLSPELFLPIGGVTALWVLAGVALALTAVGAVLFSSQEYTGQ